MKPHSNKVQWRESRLRHALGEVLPQVYVKFGPEKEPSDEASWALAPPEVGPGERVVRLFHHGGKEQEGALADALACVAGIMFVAPFILTCAAESSCR